MVFGSVGGSTTFEVPSGGSGRSGHYSGIRAQGSNEICNELITMVVPKKGTSTLLARPCRVAIRWLAFHPGPGVSCRRVLLLLLGAHAVSMVSIFARAVVGFILNLRIRVGVSQRLREPSCGVAFTGAGLWSAEPVEGVLALLDVPLLLGCVFLDVPLLLGCVLCLALCACVPLGTVLCSVGVFARAKQMLVCCVALLVERCDTCLWLLSALCGLVVNSGEVLPEFFSVGSSGDPWVAARPSGSLAGVPRGRSKTSVAEGEAIIGEASDAPLVQEEEAAVREDEPSASERQIEDIAPELIEPVGQSTEGVIPPIVPAPAIIEELVIGGAAHPEGSMKILRLRKPPVFL
ncbi:hypothetical protein Taro_032988 [Colocasia esculenta]|uniref:Uncharacterized protein n=1 Tax=Colocasia esculenta TaxID=4460 RepID=A0A843W5K3_COLES|nr:hypothetical protein [Colocasia esculenta]